MSDVAISIKSKTGETPQSFICASQFGEFANCTVEGILGDQMILASQLVSSIAKAGMKHNEEGIPFFVAAVLRDLEKAVGKENMMTGVKMLSGEVSKEDVYNRASAKAAEKQEDPKTDIEAMFEELLDALLK